MEQDNNSYIQEIQDNEVSLYPQLTVHTDDIDEINTNFDAEMYYPNSIIPFNLTPPEFVGHSIFSPLTNNPMYPLSDLCTSTKHMMNKLLINNSLSPSYHSYHSPTGIYI